MAWIKTIDEGDARGRLAELYGRALDPVSGHVDNVLKIHSLHPRGLDAHLALYKAAMHGTPSFTKADRELVAVVVSEANRCHY